MDTQVNLITRAAQRKRPGRARFLRSLLASCALCALCAAQATWAQHLGVIAPVYPVAEPDLLQWMLSRLAKAQASGELARQQARIRERAIDRINHPPAVPGIEPARQARWFHVDPSYTLQRNVFDHDGRLLFAAGTRANPLQVVSLTRHLVFFDARQPDQVRRVRALMNFYKGRLKPIVTGGSYMALIKAWRTPVYYDQAGVLTRKLGITHVPAIVSQDGLRLRVDELGPTR